MKYIDIKKYGYLGDYFLNLLEWIFYACLIGVSVGAVGAVFGLAVSYATRFRMAHDKLILLLPAAGLLIVLIYRSWGVTEPKGTNRIIKAAKGDKAGVALRTVPLIFASTVLTHLCGGSSGREGAALQIGGAIASWIGRKIKFRHLDLRVLVQCGMAAGFSALFGTPMGAAVFAMEVVSGELRYYALFPCFLSAVTAGVTASALGVAPTEFLVAEVPETTAASVIKVVLMGLLLAVLSVIFVKCLHFAAKLYEKIFKNQYIRIAAAGCIVAAITFISGTRDYNGAGMEIIEAALAGEADPLAFLWKIVFTALTLGAGFKGGEIVPTFFVGAAFGCAAAPLLSLPASFGAALGMVAMFCGVTNCPMAALLLSFELLGGRGMLLCGLSIAVSYMMSGRYCLYREQSLKGEKFSFELAASSLDSEEDAEEQRPEEKHIIPKED